MKNFDPNDINNAIVHALANLLCGDAQNSAKSLEGTIGSFFFEAAGGGSNTEPEEPPEGYCYPYRSNLASITWMCEAIFSAVRRDATCRHSQVKLIGKICELSESHMASFREARAAGTFARNEGYIRELSDDNDWGRWMIALRTVFIDHAG